MPGYGEQGGKAEDVLRAAAGPTGTGLLVSSSRGILWAGDDDRDPRRRAQARDERPI